MTTELDRCRPWIEAALSYNGGTHDWPNVVRDIADGKLQFWPAERGCLVTEIVDYPRKRVLNVFLGGGDMDQLEDMHGDVIAWAKSRGCVAATICGRPGWERAFAKHGWKPLYRVMMKDFDQ